MKEEEGYGRKRFIRLIRKIDDKLGTVINGEEYFKEVEERFQYEMKFADPIDRIVDKAGE